MLNQEKLHTCTANFCFHMHRRGVAKDTINRYQMNSWSRTFLVNTLSIPVGIILSLFTGEFENMRKGKDANGDVLKFTRTGDLLLWCARVFLALGWVFLPC